jgi:plastocyanin
MWGRNIVLFSFIISLILLGVSNPALAQNPAATFYQNPLVIEHKSILTIVDPNQPSTTTQIEANVTSNTSFLLVSLSRTSAGDFQSPFINFTSLSTQDSRLQVSVGSSVNVIYPVGAASIASVQVIANNNPLDTVYSTTFNPTLLLPRSSNATCNPTYGDDTDNDFICNNWENPSPGIGLKINYPNNPTYPLPNGVNYILPCTQGATYANDPLGATVCPSRTERDMYIEIDYMKGHRPDIDALKNVTNAFQIAPTKVNLHIILNEQINHTQAFNWPGSVGTPGFLHIKEKEFGTDLERQNTPGTWATWQQTNYTAKYQVFQYFLWGHDVVVSGAPAGSKPSGIADSANDGAVTLGSFDPSSFVATSRKQQEGTFMHELGHNLGLGHAGSKTATSNCVPNVISVMNYAYQFGDLAPSSKLDYSRKAIGTNTPGSTTLGVENTLTGTVSINVADSDPTGQYMVYGVGNGQTSYLQLPETTNTPTPYWPASWQSIRLMASGGLVFCDPLNPPAGAPAAPINLQGVNQWPLISFSHGSAYWQTGRPAAGTGVFSAPLFAPVPVSFSEQVSEPIFTSFSEPVYSQVQELTVPIEKSSEPKTVLIEIPIGTSSPGCEKSSTCFSPVSIKVNAGDTVKWTNTDTAAHTVTGGSLDDGPSGAFDSGLIIASGSFEHTFDEAGIYNYFCVVHPWMIGNVIVSTKEYDDKVIKEPPISTEEVILDFIIPEDEWCISPEEAKTQAKEHDLNMDDAPLCYSEITIDQVRAARAINTDNLQRKINSLDATAFVNPTSKQTLLDAVDVIRTLVLADDTYTAFDNYSEFNHLIDSEIIGDVNKTILKDQVNVNTYALNPTGEPPEIHIYPECEDPDRDGVCGLDPRDIAIKILIIIIIILLVILYIQNRKNTRLKKSYTSTSSFQSSP